MVGYFAQNPHPPPSKQIGTFKAKQVILASKRENGQIIRLLHEIYPGSCRREVERFTARPAISTGNDASSPNPSPLLTDSFSRIHDYLRIAITDACNLRCSYCMPDDGIPCSHAATLMTADEIEILARQFVDLGVRKIRLTGGEPLVRKDVRDILERLAALPVELTLTTNGVLVDTFLDTLLKAGVRSLNVSLDALDPLIFRSITGRDDGERVWRNILQLVEAGLHVKTNTVVMRGINDEEIVRFVECTRELPLHVRFIEFMPFDGNRWSHNQVMPAAEILDRISARYFFLKLPDAIHDTAKKFTVPGHAGTFAIISTMSAPFCEGCNRLRLTADGKMKNCLFSREETDLLSALRRGDSLEPLVRACLSNKAAALGGQLEEDYAQIDPLQVVNRSMIRIGG